MATALNRSKADCPDHPKCGKWCRWTIQGLISNDFLGSFGFPQAIARRGFPLAGSRRKLTRF
jgi:hypothetical protein